MQALSKSYFSSWTIQKSTAKLLQPMKLHATSYYKKQDWPIKFNVPNCKFKQTQCIQTLWNMHWKPVNLILLLLARSYTTLNVQICFQTVSRRMQLKKRTNRNKDVCITKHSFLLNFRKIYSKNILSCSDFKSSWQVHKHTVNVQFDKSFHMQP